MIPAAESVRARQPPARRKARTCSCCSAASSRMPSSIGRRAATESVETGGILGGRPEQIGTCRFKLGSAKSKSKLRKCNVLRTVLLTCSIRTQDWSMTNRRLQKILSQAGVASRRAAEKLIAEGRVRSMARPSARWGRKPTRRRRHRVDGRRVKAPQRLRYILLYKPAGLRHDALRSAAAADGDRSAARRPRIRLSGGTARLRHRRPAAADQRRRPRGAAHPSAPRRRAHLRGARRGNAGRRTRSTGCATAFRSTAVGRCRPMSSLAERPAAAGRDGVSADDSRRTKPSGAADVRSGRPSGAALKRIAIGPITDRRLKPGEWRELRREGDQGH